MKRVVLCGLIATVLAVAGIAVFAPVRAPAPEIHPVTSLPRITVVRIFHVQWSALTRTPLDASGVRQSAALKMEIDGIYSDAFLRSLREDDMAPAANSPEDLRLVVDLVHSDGRTVTFVSDGAELGIPALGKKRRIDEAFRRRFSEFLEEEAIQAPQQQRP